MSSSFVSNGASLEDCHCNLFCLVSAGAAGDGGGGRAVRPWAVGEGVRVASRCRCPRARPRRRSRPSPRLCGRPRETASAHPPARALLGRVLPFFFFFFKVFPLLLSCFGVFFSIVVLSLTWVLIWPDSNIFLCASCLPPLHLPPLVWNSVSLFHTFQDCPCLLHCLYALPL